MRYLREEYGIKTYLYAGKCTFIIRFFIDKGRWPKVYGHSYAIVVISVGGTVDQEQQFQRFCGIKPFQKFCGTKSFHKDFVEPSHFKKK